MVDEIKEFAEKAADQSLRPIRTGYGLKSEEEFLAVLRSQGLTQPVIRRQIERQIMADEYVRRRSRRRDARPDSDVRAYYEKHPDEFKSEDHVKWLDIFISLNKHGTPRAAYEHADTGGAEGRPIGRRFRRSGQAVRQRAGFRHGRRRRREQTRRDSAGRRGADRVGA